MLADVSRLPAGAGDGRFMVSRRAHRTSTHTPPRRVRCRRTTLT